MTRSAHRRLLLPSPTMSFPPAQPHGPLRQVFPDVFFVTGKVKMTSPPLSFSRAMTVIREGNALTLINSMRLDDAGLAQLGELGEVKNVIRIAAFHGLDDPFYKSQYGAKVFALAGSGYGKGFDKQAREADSYFQPDVWMQPDATLPISNARLFVYETASPTEGLILLNRDGGVLVAGDSLQNWSVDEYFNLPAKILMRLMGFIKPHNVGPGWYKASKPDPAEIRTVLDLEFDHVLPVHGEPVLGGAKDKYRPAIERLI